LHVPSVPETKGIINDDTLRQMKPGAVLINTARGDLVREEALAQALEAGRLGGAGLDVYLEEAAVDPRLRAAPGTVLLPHLGCAPAARAPRSPRRCAVHCPPSTAPSSMPCAKQRSASTRSSPSWGVGGWPPCTSPTISPSTARWRSRCWRRPCCSWGRAWSSAL